ncbi:MAG: tetratricopeptide repeat protein [Spirochaetes bacterium]|nr:tetratricopeptide repeat protein [Spirochaetota bacterium]
MRFKIALLSLTAAAALTVTGCAARGSALAPDEASRLCKSAWTSFSRGFFRGAEKEFLTVVQGTETDKSQSASLASALYGLGIIYNFGDRIDRSKAVQFYERAVAVGGTNDMAAWAMLARARLYEVVPMGQKPDYEAARKEYRAVMARFPNHPAAEEAFLYLSTTYLITYNIDDARKALVEIETYIKNRPTTLYKERLYDILANAYNNITMNLNAKMTIAERMEIRKKGFDIGRERLKLLEADTKNPVANDIAAMLWTLGTSAELNLGDLPLAKNYLNDLVKRYPYDFRAPLAAIELKRIERIERTGIVQ